MTVVSYKPPIVSSSGATISADGLYRFDLWRIWNHAIPPAHFVMLNPSTANGMDDDNTIRRCVRFANSWGCGGLTVTNLFAWRAKDQVELAGMSCKDAIGGAIADLTTYNRAAKAGVVVVAWGVGGSLSNRGREVLSLLRPLSPVCLGLTGGGQPRHPLYVRADKTRESWPYPGT